MQFDRLRSWKILKNEEVYDGSPWVKLSIQQISLPDGSIVDDYYQIKLPDYCLIFAQTDDARILVERQYKHGFGRVSLTLPAGSIEDGEKPLEAAKRELLEETGSVSDDWRSLGSFITHGNYRCCVAHLFHARKVRRIAEPNSGDLEEMDILSMDLDDLIDCIETGEIESLSSVTAILLAARSIG